MKDVGSVASFQMWYSLGASGQWGCCIRWPLRISCSLSAGISASSCVCACMLNHVQLFAAVWMRARQAPLSMGFSRQEYWSGLPFPSPGDLPNPGIEPASPSLQEDFTCWPIREAKLLCAKRKFSKISEEQKEKKKKKKTHWKLIFSWDGMGTILWISCFAVKGNCFGHIFTIGMIRSHDYWGICFAL